MMRLLDIKLSNYRGFNQLQQFDLRSRVLLFYGLNGRGKSTVFNALEMGLFPKEMLADLKLVGGEEVPLVNRFNTTAEAGVGRIILTLEQDGQIVEIEQRVRDKLSDVQPAQHELLSTLTGHRHRIFFTQRLLRDVILGTPHVRYQRVRQWLGCDAYDGLAIAIARWASDRNARVSELEYRLTRVGQMKKEVQDALKLANQALPKAGIQAEESGFVRGAPMKFYRAVRHELTQVDSELTEFSLRVGKPVSFKSVTLRLRDASAIVDRLFRFVGPSTHMDDLIPHLHPAALFEPLNRVRARRNELAQLSVVARTALEDVSGPWEESPDYNTLRNRLTALKPPGWEANWTHFNHTLDQYRSAQVETEAALTNVRERIDRFSVRLRTYLEAARRLRQVEQGLTLMQQERVGSTQEGEALLLRRRALLIFLQGFYNGLLELTHGALQERLGLLREYWQKYYRLINSYSHFQNVDLVADRVTSAEADNVFSPWWQVTPAEWGVLRFTVNDPQDREQGKRLPMETILSEGQLNCAAVGLALSLSEVASAPLKVLALDDPFVSWDDVNMENFFAAVRRLAAKDWTVILSTCDHRVVTSLKRNMETVRVDNPAMVYTFTDWGRERGPVVERDAVVPRSSKHLSELGSDFRAHCVWPVDVHA